MTQKKSYSLTPVPMGHSNAYLIAAGGSAVLVDAGCRSKINKLESALLEKGLEFPDLSLLILTHTHHDHTGCLSEVKERSGAKVLVHEVEASFLEKGYTPFPKGTMWFSRIISGLSNSLFVSRARYAPVKPDIVINKEYDLEHYLPGVKATVIPTPGHTGGSVSVVLENEEAIVGDTLFNKAPIHVYPPFANDEKQLLRSWEKLAETGCSTFYPGHGAALSIEKLADKYRKLSTKI